MVIRWACMICVLGSVAAAGPPQRVLSMNLCTDQLALMLAFWLNMPKRMALIPT